MLMHFFSFLAENYSFLNVFRYITFRTGGAVLTSLLISFLWGPVLIAWLRQLQKKGQPIREDGPQSHLLTKQGIPTMGGALILISLTTSTLLWADITSKYVIIVLLTTLGFGAIGFADDFLKVSKANVKGVPGKVRLCIGSIIAACFAIWVHSQSSVDLAGYLAVPFFKDTLIYLGMFMIIFYILVILGSANAVNLTDGLDGLATMPVIIAASAFGLIAYLTGNIKFADYLQIHYVADAGELSVFCGALIGAGLGFLWFNAPPAEIFMGDTGSLALGAGLGSVAVVTKHELVWAVIGGLFVAETVSVILQVASFKLTGKRIFRMAPLHHHFEQQGWQESKIVIRFWIVAVILALIGLSTLKLR